MIRHRLRELRCGREPGQAALGLVLLLVLLLVTTGAGLAANAMQHDPMVQTDVLDHYAYRALEAGMNSYLHTINDEPRLVNCSTTSTLATCPATTYDAWTQVPATTLSTAAVPEWYLWANPQLCFSTTHVKDTKCSSSSSSGNLEYVQVLVIGAAGTPGHYQYESSVANYQPANGFLTHVWWSKYESEPTSKSATTSACKWDYTNGYNGPGAACDPVYFGATTHVNGPVFSDDSIYILHSGASGPTFGTTSYPSPVVTADPHCLFVTQPGTTDGSPTKCKTASAGVYYTKTNSRYGATTEKPPATDSELQQVAALDGCVYSGPTTISFYATATNHKGYMNVTSPETPVTATTHYDLDNMSTNHNICTETTPGTGIRAPTSTNGNGVIYIATASGGCTGNHDNPFDGLRTGTHIGAAQIVAADHYSGTSHGYNYTDDTSKEPDCEGDAFVRNADSSNTPSGKVAGLAGNLTVAAQNNVVITGNLTYTSCGTAWTSKTTCSYHPGSVNDSLGLIANNYVLVNRPVKPRCTSTYSKRSGTTWTCPASDTTGSGWTVEPSCSATVSDILAALCNPGPTLTIDAALLDLSHSYAVDNYKAGGLTGTLVVYGAVDQYWRGPVGLYGATGYTKYYTWDSRLQYVSIPSYLTPGTPSWTLASSSVVMSSTCPTWPNPYNGSPTGPGTVARTKTTDPSGAATAC